MPLETIATVLVICWGASAVCMIGYSLCEGERPSVCVWRALTIPALLALWIARRERDGGVAQ